MSSFANINWWNDACSTGGIASGGRFAGYGFYLLKGKPVFLWNLVDLEHSGEEIERAIARIPG